MKRLYRLLPSELNQIQRQLYDNITNGRRSNAKNQFRLSDREGSLEGPFNLFVMFPDLGSILSNLGEFIRYESKLPSRLRELMILHIAVDFQSEFEWYAHKQLAINEGISVLMIESIRDGNKPENLDARESISYELYQKLKTHESITDEFFSKVTEHLDTEMIFELISLVGYYSTLAMLMQTFCVSIPDGEELTFQHE